MSTTTSGITKSPSAPSDENTEPSKYIEVENIFRIVYKDGSNITYKNFTLSKLEGETQKEHLGRAINRAFKFCERMRYRFIHCDPFIINLDTLEERMSGL